MRWERLETARRFTSLNEVFRMVGEPKFKLGDGNTYYLGEGYFLLFSDMKFGAENGRRIELIFRDRARSISVRGRYFEFTRDYFI